MMTLRSLVNGNVVDIDDDEHALRLVYAGIFEFADGTAPQPPPPPAPPDPEPVPDPAPEPPPVPLGGVEGAT